MRLLDITLLLAILIFVIISCNHQVSSKKSALKTHEGKKHSHTNKHQIRHHKQHFLHHKKQSKKIHTNKKHSQHIKHYKQSKKHQKVVKSQNKKHQKVVKSQSHKQHLVRHKKKHFNNKLHRTSKSKQHRSHHNLKVSHRHNKPLNNFFQETREFCPQIQNPRIILGEVANETSFPYAAIYYVCDRHVHSRPVSHKGCHQWCGGSIISHFHVLTAAHCLMEDRKKMAIPKNIPRNPDTILVRVGVHNLSEPEENADGYRTTLAVKDLIIHKDYLSHGDPQYPTNDIAIIRLKDEIRFSALIRPVCINGLHLNYEGIFKYAHPLVVVAGWGAISQDGTLSNVLKYAYNQYIFNFLHHESNKVFSVSTYNWGHGYTCKGDSGSGLLPVDDTFSPVNVIIGVYYGVYGPKDCSVPTLYANVTTYSQWINEVAL